MIYREAQPASDLARFIRCFWTLEYRPSGDRASEPVLPDGCPEIVFNLADRFVRIDARKEELQPATIVAGQMNRSITIRPSGDVLLFGVRLQPVGASVLIDCPAPEITNQIIEIYLACGRRGVELEERISDALSFAGRIAIFEDFYRTVLVERKVDAMAVWASELISGGDGRLPITKIASFAGISDRQFERRFKHAIGISPKAFSRIVRFQSVIRSFQAGSSVSLLDSALSFGYYDQSHLIRDFREFAAATPLDYFARTHQISDVFTAAA